jgi:hypothetical protein
LKRLVASTTLKDVTWNASVISGDVAAKLMALKEQPDCIRGVGAPECCRVS